MKKNTIHYLTVLLAFFNITFAQQAKVAKADKKYNNYAYVDAIKTYERVAEKGYKSVEIFEKLGNAHYFNSNFEQSAKWYSELYAMDKNMESEYLYRYYHSLKATGDYKKANEILNEFNKKSNSDSRGTLAKENKNSIETIKANKGQYKIENAGINSKYSDYGSSFFMNKLVFATARDTGSVGQRKHTWTGQHFTNLYTAELGEEMSPSLPNKFTNNINSKFNESTPIFTKDGKTMYFTRNNFLAGKKGKSGSDITLIKIYKATFNNNNWENIVELPFNSDNYSTAHPALSTDEKTLYFASDMPGTFGQSDLFKVQINDNGSFGTPENLGNNINTEGKETFPFVSQDNELFFASDGHPGLGGLDIFATKINSNNTFGEVQNIDADINSSKDDFAYLIDGKTNRGFFTSNRDGGEGYDDIYKFLRTPCDQLLNGLVTDSKSKTFLPNTKISLYDNQFQQLDSTYTDEKGYYSIKVNCGKTYNVRAEKQDYTTVELKSNIPNQSGKTQLDFAIDKEACKIAIGDDLGVCFGIKNIYFDLDKSNIHAKAKIDLEKILDVMKQNPTMKLDIRSHTDSRASFKYNESLSSRRAKSTMEWLVQNGIEKTRLTGKGYGESQLVNNCSDGIKCSDDEHQANRRSEFIITAL